MFSDPTNRLDLYTPWCNKSLVHWNRTTTPFLLPSGCSSANPEGLPGKSAGTGHFFVHPKFPNNLDHPDRFQQSVVP